MAHGFGKHGSVREVEPDAVSLHSGPLKPAAQAHVNVRMPLFAQVPPFKHGFGLHGFSVDFFLREREK